MRSPGRGRDAEFAGGFLAAMAILGALSQPMSTFAGPIHEAARDGDLKRVEQLVGNDPGLVRSRDFTDSTPLDRAASRGHRDIIVFLLDHGADPNAADRLGRTPLLMVKDCRRDLVELLESRGADVRAKGKDGWTALHWAAQCGSEDSAAYLLSRGIEVDARCSGPFGTPLEMAASNGRVGVARLLLARGADANARVEDGSTPLHTAAWHGKAEMVKLLLDHRADPNARRARGLDRGIFLEEGGTPLHDAAQFGQAEVVGILIAGGADVNARTALEQAPLHLASAKGRAAIVKRLLDAGADPGAFDKAGLTPLHQIALDGDIESATLVLDRGADVDVRSRPSQIERLTSIKGPGPPQPSANTPLHYASRGDRADLVRLLLARKADPNARNSLSQTPLDLARSEAVSALLREAAGRKK